MDLAMALPRVVAALLENHQTPEGIKILKRSFLTPVSTLSNNASFTTSLLLLLGVGSCAPQESWQAEMVDRLDSMVVLK